MGLPVAVENHSHSCRCGKIVEEQEQIGAAEQEQSIGVARQERNIGVVERFEQVQIERKRTHTEVRRSEQTDQKAEHIVVRKLAHTGVQKAE